MTKFYYKLKTLQGQLSSGTISASSQSEARSLLQTQNVTLISIKPLLFWQRIFQKSKSSPLALLQLFRSLSQLCRAGLPLIDALKALDNSSSKTSYQCVIYLLESGLPFSKALYKSTLMTNELLISFIEKAEQNGDYPHSFEQITKHILWMEDLKKRLKKTLSYPLLVLTFSLGIMAFLISFVIPQLIELYTMNNLEIPPMTNALLTFSNYSGTIFFGIIGFASLITILMFSFIFYGNYSPIFIRRFLTNFLRIAPFGKYLRDILLLQYITGIQVILSARKSDIIMAMYYAEKSINPSFFKGLFSQIRLCVKKGEPFSKAIKNNIQIPTTIYKMLQVGEKSGTFQNALKHIISYIDKDLQDSLEKLIQRLGPFMLLLVGGLLLFIVAGIFLPLYSGLGNMEGI